MPQSIIQRWIERIPHNIKEIICLEGDNEYKEGHPEMFDGRKARRESHKTQRATSIVFQQDTDSLINTEGETDDEYSWEQVDESDEMLMQLYQG